MLQILFCENGFHRSGYENCPFSLIPLYPLSRRHIRLMGRQKNRLSGSGEIRTISKMALIRQVNCEVASSNRGSRSLVRVLWLIRLVGLSAAEFVTGKS